MMMTATAAVVDEPGGSFALREVRIDSPRPDEVLVRIAGVGICHTDLIARDQVIPTMLPAVLGHEGAGVVEAVGHNVTELSKGDSVVLSYMSCGTCPRCIVDQQPYCTGLAPLNFIGNRIDGSSAYPNQGISSHFFGQSSFGTYAIAHRRNAVKVESSLELALLGPLGCGIQTGAGAVLNVLRATESTSILIVGAGAVGLSAALAALCCGYTRVVVMDPVANRRDAAISLGVHEALDPNARDIDQRLTLEPFENVIDTSGNPAGLEKAMAATAVRGHCILLGSPSVPGQTFPLRFGMFVQKGINLRGVIEGDANPHLFIPQLLALQKRGRFPFERLIRKYSFEDINKAASDQKSGLCVKPVLMMDSGSNKK